MIALIAEPALTNARKRLSPNKTFPDTDLLRSPAFCRAAFIYGHLALAAATMAGLPELPLPVACFLRVPVWMLVVSSPCCAASSLPTALPV